MNCSVDVFTLLCNAVQLAKDEQIRSVSVLRSRLSAHHPGQASLIDAAIARYLSNGSLRTSMPLSSRLFCGNDSAKRKWINEKPLL